MNYGAFNLVISVISKKHYVKISSGVLLPPPIELPSNLSAEDRMTLNPIIIPEAVEIGGLPKASAYLPEASMPTVIPPIRFWRANPNLPPPIDKK